MGHSSSKPQRDKGWPDKDWPNKDWPDQPSSSGGRNTRGRRAVRSLGSAPIDADSRQWRTQSMVEDAPPPYTPPSAQNLDAHLVQSQLGTINATPVPMVSRPRPRGRPNPAVEAAARRHSDLTPRPFADRQSSQPLSSQSVSSRPVQTRRRTGYANEDALEQLFKYDTVIVVDDSSSMAGPHWHETREALAQLAEIATQYDADGIDVCFLNCPRFANCLRTAVEVKALFDSVLPYGVTPIGERLEQLLLKYLSGLERAQDRYENTGDNYVLSRIKPVNYIVLTDGSPTDDPATVIITAARRLDARHFPVTQVGIQFVQIGSLPEATEFLRELDDTLCSNFAIRDMVDTTPYRGKLDAETLTKVMLGGINRRVDTRGGRSVMA